MFEKLGWTGFVFDPLPEIKKLYAQHRNCTFFPYAISDKQQDVEFSVVKDCDVLSSITGEAHMDLTNFDVETITVQAFPLSEVFKTQHTPPQHTHHIDYMSIDTEGHEMQVLQGIDFEKIHISVLSIENNSHTDIDKWGIIGQHEYRQFMESKEYVFYMRIIGLDDFYVHKSLIT